MASACVRLVRLAMVGVVAAGPIVVAATPAMAADEAVARVLAARAAGRDWRAELGPNPARLPLWRETVSVAGAVSGRIVAGRVRLPATVAAT